MRKYFDDNENEITKEEWEQLIERNKTRARKVEQIRLLKKELAEEDYKIIKCYEAQLTNNILPYDIGVLKTKRDGLRLQINELRTLIEE